MDNDISKPFELPKDQIIAKLQKENKWYAKKYGPVIEKRGMHNWNNLFRMPNIYEWTIMAMLILAIFMGWAYQHDIEAAKINIYRTIAHEYEASNTNTYSINPLGNVTIFIKEANSIQEEQG